MLRGFRHAHGRQSATEAPDAGRHGWGQEVLGGAKGPDWPKHLPEDITAFVTSTKEGWEASATKLDEWYGRVEEHGVVHEEVAPAREG